MKKNGFLFLMPAAMLFALGACSASSTSRSEPQQTSSISDKDAAIREVYELYIQNAKEKGETPLSYEEWLASIKGEKGDKGDKGEKGDKGDKGSDGTSVLTGHGTPSSDLGSDGDSYVDLDTWDYFIKTDESWLKVGNIKGADGHNGSRGEKGDTGATGAQGEKGDKGDKGETGATGDKGDKGDQGEKGDKGDKGQDGITYIPCIFNNYDGSKLYEFYFEKGAAAVYEGQTPTKPDETDGDQVIHWTFKGWDKPLENIQKPTIFTAQYECSRHTCTFQNYDGTTLWTTTVNHGESVTYQGQSPTKPNTISGSTTIQWIFAGWDKSLDNIKTDTVFTAQFYAPNAIKCTFVNYDGSILSLQYCGAGDRIYYEGGTPTKQDSTNGDGVITKYEFIGWDKSLKNIQADTIFTAQYSSSIYYECKFVNHDGSLLYVVDVFEGGQASYFGETPTRSQEADGTTITEYAFIGWDKSLSNVSAPITFTAQYSSYTFTGFKVTFLESDETELYSYYCEQGVNAVYPYDMPFSYDSEDVNMFVGWSGPINNIQSTTTVKAIYKRISRRQNGEYPQRRVSDKNLISALDSLNSFDSQGYYVYEGDRYAKVEANEYGVFSDGTEFYWGEIYWFKVEPIRWKLLSSEVGDLFLASEYLLDRCNYDPSSNNYKNSGIRAWLNSTFLDKAFYYDDSLIKTTAVDNSVASTGYQDNPYVCETTYDKVFLLSYAETTNPDYGFDNDANRMCQATDYAAAVGAYKDRESGTGYWWTRSPGVNGPEYARDISHYGDAGNNNIVTDNHSSVRPALHFSLN